jgi:multidrug efflux system outer membrane protein
MFRTARPAIAAVLASLLGACAVGPNYYRPEIATPPAYSELSAQPKAPFSQPLAEPVDESQVAAWWKGFDDPILNALIEQALKGNLDLQTDYARIRQAREQEVVSGAAGLPHASVAANVARINDNASSFDRLVQQGGAGGGAEGGQGGFAFPSSINNFAVAFDATWEPDVFGGVRRSVEAARAGAEVAIWTQRDGEVSLTSEVARDYLTLRALQVEIAIAQQEVARQQDTFAIIAQQRETGFVTQLNVNQQQAQVQATIAAIPNLQSQARAQIHAIGVLLGQDPEALDAQLSNRPTGPLPGAPKTLPVGLPSDLLRRRPDVREAERRLAQYTAEVGVQVANLYPKFNLIALAPFASNTISGLFDANNAVSVGVGVVQWPIFSGGRTRAGIRAARAQQDQAYYAYKKAVLGALQDVEDALARYDADQRRIVADQATVDAANNSLVIARQQYEVGLVTYINILQAQQTLLNGRNSLTQDQGQLATDLVSLYKALGGGWTADEGKLTTKAGVSWP